MVLSGACSATTDSSTAEQSPGSDENPVTSAVAGGGPGTEGAGTGGTGTGGAGTAGTGATGTQGLTATTGDGAQGGTATTAPGSVSTAPPDTAPRRGGTLRVLLAADPTPIVGWTPWDHTCAWSCRNVLDHVLETLTVVLPDGSVEPWLAQSVSADDSLRRWTVTLRPGISFTDGEPLTALAVKTGIDDYLRSGRASGSHLRDARITSVVAAAELSLVFELSEPNAGLPAALAGPVGRVFSIAAAKADPETFAREPVGTGPFIFERWSPGDPVVLGANPDYWRTAEDGSTLPRVAEVVFSEIADERGRLEALLDGRADVLTSRSAELSAAAGAANDHDGRPISAIRRFDDNASAILFNLLRAPLDDVRVRRALLRATDASQLIAALGPEVDSPAATQWWSPASIWYSEDVASAWPTADAQRADALLKEYTQDPERSDGRDVGETVRVKVLCTDDPALARMTAELERHWEATGLVEVDVETVARTGLISRVMGSVVQNPSFSGDFGATCWRVGGESDPAVLVAAAVGPVRTTPLNVSNFADEYLASLASLIKSATSEAERRRAVADFMMELANQAPYVLLTYASSVVAATADVVGLGRTTLPGGGVVDGQRLGVSRYDEVWLHRE